MLVFAEREGIDANVGMETNKWFEGGNRFSCDGGGQILSRLGTLADFPLDFLILVDKEDDENGLQHINAEGKHDSNARVIALGNPGEHSRPNLMVNERRQINTYEGAHVTNSSQKGVAT